MATVIRSQILALCFACSAIVSAQDLNKPLTYRTVAVPLHVALDDLSKQAGVTLGTSQELEDEPIILVFNAAKTQDAMDHIASAIGAEWQKQSPTQYLLIRSRAIEDKLTKEAFDLRKKNIVTAIARITKQTVAKSPLVDQQLVTDAKSLAAIVKMEESGKQENRAFEAIQDSFPAKLALNKLLLLLPVDKIANLRRGDKIVFSTHPNSQQEPLPEQAESIGEELQSAQNLFADTFLKEHPQPVIGFEHSLDRTTARMQNPPAKILVIVDRSEFGDEPDLTMIAIDDKGVAVDYANDILRSYSMEDYRTTYQLILAKSKDAPQITLSGDSTVVSKALRATLKHHGNPPPLSTNVASLLLDAGEHDPLSFIVSDGFFALATSDNKNLVAYPDDEATDANYIPAEDSNFKLPSFLQVMDTDYHMSISVDDGWIVAAPKDRLEAWRSRTNRELLGKCLMEAYKQGYISITSASALALSERSTEDAMLPDSYSLLGLKYAPFIERDKGLLRFYSSLSPDEMTVLQGGGKLASSQLTREQWELMTQVAYRGGPRVEIIADDIKENGEIGGYVLARESTEFMPDGLPTGATVSLKDETTDTLFMATKWMDDIFQTEYPLQEIGQYIAEKQVKPNSDRGDVLWISPGRSHDLIFEFNLTATHKRVGKLREVEQGNEKWTLDKLPPDLKAKLDAAIAAARTQLDKTAASPGDQPPPQPPHVR
jgi:hypothetical protein